MVGYFVALKEDDELSDWTFCSTLLSAQKLCDTLNEETEEGCYVIFKAQLVKLD